MEQDGQTLYIYVCMYVCMYLYMYMHIFDGQMSMA